VGNVADIDRDAWARVTAKRKAKEDRDAVPNIASAARVTGRSEETIRRWCLDCWRFPDVYRLPDGRIVIPWFLRASLDWRGIIARVRTQHGTTALARFLRVSKPKLCAWARGDCEPSPKHRRGIAAAMAFPTWAVRQHGAGEKDCGQVGFRDGFVWAVVPIDEPANVHKNGTRACPDSPLTRRIPPGKM